MRETWKINETVFHTDKEYREALSDQKKIEELRNEFDWDDRASLLILLEMIDDKEIIFYSSLGRKFEDEIFERSETLKTSSNLGKNQKKSSGIQTNYKKQSKKKDIKLSDFDSIMQEQILQEMKKKEHRRIGIIILCFFIAVGSFSYFFLYNYMLKRSQENVNQWAEIKEDTLSLLNEKEFEFKPNLINDTIDASELEILDEYKILIEKNKTLIGWIKIDDTYIDYPVMQAADNEYYLDYNFNHEKDVNGSIFMDYRSDFVNRDTNLIIYGHNMRSGKMFGSLREYADVDYYKEHSIIQFDTIYEKGVYEIMYVFHGQIYNESDITFKYYQFFNANSKKEFDSYMESMDELSLYDTGVRASYGDQLLTLSTCDGSDATKRFVVVAKRIE